MEMTKWRRINIVPDAPDREVDETDGSAETELGTALRNNANGMYHLGLG
jgi:hypothetical protein